MTVKSLIGRKIAEEDETGKIKNSNVETSRSWLEQGSRLHEKSLKRKAKIADGKKPMGKNEMHHKTKGRRRNYGGGKKAIKEEFKACLEKRLIGLKRR